MVKPFVFTLMPFDKSFNDTYKLGIKAAVEEAGGYCERVDEQVYEERMLDRIYNQINKADFIIADVTGKNPNVFYEIGYAHALGKRVILLTNTPDDIPFDLRHHYHIVYDSQINYLKDELIRRLTWYFVNPEKLLSDTEQLEFYIEKQKLIDGGKIVLNRDNPDKFIFRDKNEPKKINFKIDIHNFSKTIFNANCKIGTIVGKDYKLGENSLNRYINLPNDQKLYITPDFTPEIFPDAWTSLMILDLSMDSLFILPLWDVEIPITMRFFMETGTKDLNYTIILTSTN